MDAIFNLFIFVMIGLGIYYYHINNPDKIRRFKVKVTPGAGVGRGKNITINDDQKPKTRFSDVAGIDEAKEELKEIVDFIKNPDRLGRLGGRVPKGALLVGPPGVGKTLIARAVAGEAEASFEYMSGSAFVEMYVGVGASRARDLFSRAAQKAPCIIFIDEIDAVGKRKDSISRGNDEYNQTINQILTEMDGFTPNKGVVVMAATNKFSEIDPAFLRPGRFDRIIHIHLPDVRGREEILKIHTRSVVLSPTVNLKRVAQITSGFSGADLANLINEAAISAARTPEKTDVGIADIELSLDRIRMGAENKSLSSVMTEDEKKILAYHESGHAIVAVSLPENDPVDKVSIIPRGQALGTTTLMPERDRYNFTKDYLEELMCMLLGGRLAEEMVFNKISTGAQNDIERVTQIAREMVCSYGMSRMGTVNYKITFDNQFSEDTKREIDIAIRELIDKAKEKSKKILTTKRGQLDRLASTLLKKEVLSRAEIEEILKES